MKLRVLKTVTERRTYFRQAGIVLTHTRRQWLQLCLEQDKRKTNAFGMANRL